MDIGSTLVSAALGSESGTSMGAGSGERGGQVQEGENKANRRGEVPEGLQGLP